MKKKPARSRTATPANRSRARQPSAAVEFVQTPPAMDSSPSQSPESAVFGNSTKKSKAAAAFASPSTSLGSISDLKDMTSSRLEDLKRHVDRSHVAIVKELDASHSRIHKRFKNQNQECQKTLEEAEKEYKKTSDWIRENQETSYAELMAEAQASTSHVCKTSIPKLSQSFEKAIDAL